MRSQSLALAESIIALVNVFVFNVDALVAAERACAGCVQVDRRSKRSVSRGRRRDGKHVTVLTSRAGRI